MCRVDKCCFGCSLREGTSIVLWCTVVLCSFITYYIFSTFLMDATAPVDPDFHNSKFKGPYFYNTWIINFGITVIIQIGLVTAILGLYGIRKNWPEYLTPFLNFLRFCMACLVCLVLVMLMFVMLISFDITSGNKESAGPAGRIVFFVIVLTVYSHNVTKSYRDTVLEEVAANNGIAAPSAPPTA